MAAAQPDAVQPRGVRFEQDGAVGRIVLDRPAASNSVDLPAAHAFGAAVTAAEADDIRSVLVTGEGKRFCAGGDVSSFLAADEPQAYLLELATHLEAELRRLSELPKPVVAAVHGAVAGAGLAFVLKADVVVAERSTRLLTAYAGIGLTPDCGVSYELPRAVGQQRALELALTGRVLTADEARDWGLVTEVVEDGGADARGAEVAAALAAGPTRAYGETKRLLRGSWETTKAASAQDEARTIAAMVTSEDAQQLIARFVGRS